MLFRVEYERPPADYPSADGDCADFDAIFDDPLVPDSASPEFVLGLHRYRELRYWIIEYGRANGAVGATIFLHHPKRLGPDLYRHPAGQRLVEAVEIEPAILEPLKAENQRLADVDADHWQEILSLRERVRELEQRLTPDPPVV